MEKTIQLLSSRFLDDKKPWMPQNSSIRKATKKLHAIFYDKDNLVRISHKKCPLCHGDQANVIAQKDRYGLSLETQVCKSCGFVYSSEYFSSAFAEEYYANYADEFKSLNRSPMEMFEMRTSPQAYTWIRQNYIKEYLRYNYEKVKLVIEVGCNDGCNLYPYQLDGKEVVGCDFDEQRIGAGRSAELTIFRGGIDVLLREGYKADLLILCGVLEHMLDIDETLQNVRELLAPQGLLYIEVPGILWHTDGSSISSIKGYPRGNNILPYLQLEHNYCFELGTLKQFVCRNGFRMVAGDEVIRSLFVIDDQQEICTNDKNNSMSILKFLQSVEENYQRRNPFIKLWLRHIYYSVKK